MVLMAEEKNKLNWESINTLSFNDEYKVPLTLEKSLNEISFRKDPLTQNYLEFSDIYGETWKPVMSASAILNLLKTVDTNDSGLNADTLDGYQPSIPVYIPVLETDPILSTVVVRGTDNSISTSIIKFTTNMPVFNLSPGQLAWNSKYKTLDLKINSDVTLQLGQEDVILVKNGEDDVILNGQIVYAHSSDNSYIIVKRAQAARVDIGTLENPNIVDLSKNVMGIATEDIATGNLGFITQRGLVGSLNTSMFTDGDKLFLSPIIRGGLTKDRPVAPNSVVEIGYVVDADLTTGKIFAALHELPNAEDVSYNNQILAEDDQLLATNVQSAIDELQLKKADVGLLSSNINLYPTTASSDIVGYNRMVSLLDDPDYNTTAVDISTGIINTDDQLVGQLIADAGLFVGNPGIINITTIGNIKRTSGNNNQYAAFYFKVWQRNLAGDETLIATSNETPDVRPLTTDVYEQFSASALLNNGIFLSTDRIVIRYYANLTGNTGAVYAFQFGGLSPVRTLIPVPISVIPSADASGIMVSTTNFNENTILKTEDDNVQAALERLNTHNHDARYYTETELNNGQLNDIYYTETELNNGQLNNLYYTETELNNGQLDNLYYTKLQIDTSLSGKVSTSTGVIIEGNFPIYANTDGNLLADSGYSSQSFGLKDNGTFTGAMNIPTIVENGTVVSAAANSSTTLNVLNGISVYYFTDNNTANWTINFQGTDAVSLNTLTTGKAVTVSILARNGATPYRPTSFSIQGSAVTPRWQGGTAPTTGNANSTDIYTFTIIRLASGFELLASQTRFA